MKLWRYGHAIERRDQRYQLLGMLGSGGMADVCQAMDEHTQREVAIKVIKTEHITRETLKRFLKEGALVAGWKHPHILPVYDDVQLELLDPQRGSMVPYIVMEYVRGGSLHHRLGDHQPYPLHETVATFAQLCDAVQYAHDKGVIHRDIKPPNVLFRILPDASEDVVLSDFGLAVSLDATHHTFPQGGTPMYMAPEQRRGQSQKETDIFALGVLLYRLCTGQLPFRLTDFSGPLPEPTRPSALNPALPPALDAVLFTALKEDPTERFPRADLFWERVNTLFVPVNGGRPNPPISDLHSAPFILFPPAPGKSNGISRHQEAGEVVESKHIDQASPPSMVRTNQPLVPPPRAMPSSTHVMRNEVSASKE